MIELALRVVYNGDKLELREIKGSDLVALERQFNLSLSQARSLTFEQCCFLVWRMLRRQGHPGDFNDEFLDAIEDLEEIDPLEDQPAGGEASPG